MMSQMMENGGCFVSNSTSIPKYKRRNISAVRDFPPGCGPYAPGIDIRSSVESKLQMDDLVTHEFLQSEDFETDRGPDETFIKPSSWDTKLTNFVSPRNLKRKYPQRTQVSAIRDFPLLLGRHAPLLTKAECIKTQSSTMSKLLPRDSEKSDFKDKTVVSDSKPDECAGGAKIGKEVVVYDPDKGGAEILDAVGVGKEIVVHSQGSRLTEKPLTVSKKSDKVIVYALKAVRSADKCSKTGSSSEHSIGNVAGYALTTKPNYQGIQNNRADQTLHSTFQKTRELKHGSSIGVNKSKMKKLAEERRALIAKSTEKKASSGDLKVIPVKSSFPWQHDESCEAFYGGGSTRVVDLAAAVPNTSNSYYKVRETLRLFRDVYDKLTDEKEAALRMGAVGKKRVDLAAATFLKKHGKYVNTSKVVGSVPGVDIGLEFHYRAELAIVGLHRPPQAGIDYTKKGGTVIAISIVASGGYADDMNSADVLNYSGCGGNPSKGDNEFEDQKLERGNLALKNSIAAKNPVRVVRGHDHKISGVGEKARTFKTYTYDGLYTVTKYWQERGPSGNLVYMFRLERLPGQPELAWNLSR